MKPTVKNSEPLGLFNEWFSGTYCVCQLPPCRSCPPYLSLLGLYPSGLLEPCSRVCQHYRPSCLCHGGCRFQGQVVSRLPSSGIERVQRIRKQLVECTFRASSTRFLEVGCPYIYRRSLFTDCFHRYDFFQTLCLSFRIMFYIHELIRTVLQLSLVV